jgi:ATP-dependent Lon protease
MSIVRHEFELDTDQIAEALRGDQVRTYPVLALRACEVLPGKRECLLVHRAKSRNALPEAIRSNGVILFATQRNADDDDPVGSALYELATVGRILELRRLIDDDGEDDGFRVIVDGMWRVKIIKFGPNTWKPIRFRSAPPCLAMHCSRPRARRRSTSRRRSAASG